MGNNEFDNLSERKQQILLNAVEEYIQVASPITSSNIRNKCCADLSTATLRNELNALEAMGYLKQLHTSSGRVPTSKGYRFFVNTMMADIPLDKQTLNDIHGLFEQRTIYLGDMLNEIASIVSKATNYPTIVMLKGFEKLIIKNIKIIPLLTGQALILIETTSGVINNSMPADPNTPNQTYIDAGNFLTKTFNGRTVAEMIKDMPDFRNTMDTELNEFKTIFDTLILSLNSIIDDLTEHNVASRGELQLLNSPEYSDLNKAKRVIDVMQNRDEITKLLDERLEDAEDVAFKIGKEIPLEDLQECSIVRADYQVGEQSTVSLGIIGPQRMDYAKIASALKFVVGEFNNLKAINQQPKGDKDE
ncbi:MAG: heat-inducible transcription repressor HrcA [Clostridia bacterium]|nr:heat-inducible transcription repressor HrcA [Clostridia bacterium]